MKAKIDKNEYNFKFAQLLKKDYIYNEKNFNNNKLWQTPGCATLL